MLQKHWSMSRLQVCPRSDQYWSKTDQNYTLNSATDDLIFNGVNYHMSEIVCP